MLISELTVVPEFMMIISIIRELINVYKIDMHIMYICTRTEKNMCNDVMSELVYFYIFYQFFPKIYQHKI